MFPTPKDPQANPNCSGDQHACAKEYALFAEGIGLLELLRPLPIKPDTGKYPGWIGSSSTAHQQWGKRKDNLIP